MAEWKIIFFIAAAFYFSGNLIFVIFGKASIQPWNEKKDETTHSSASDDTKLGKVAPPTTIKRQQQHFKWHVHNMSQNIAKPVQKNLTFFLPVARQYNKNQFEKFSTGNNLFVRTRTTLLFVWIYFDLWIRRRNKQFRPHRSEELICFDWFCYIWLNEWQRMLNDAFDFVKTITGLCYEACQLFKQQTKCVLFLLCVIFRF